MLAQPSADDAEFAQSVLDRAVGQLALTGVDLDRGSVALTRQLLATGERGWRLTLTTSHGQRRVQGGLRLPARLDAAAPIVAQALGRLVGPFRMTPDDPLTAGASSLPPSPVDEGGVRAPPVRDGLGARIAVEATMGLLGAVVGMATGILAVAAVDSLGDCLGVLCSVDAAGVAMMAVGLVGVASGVTVGGAISGGRGHFGWSLLGTIAGGAVVSPFFVVALAQELDGGGAGEQVALASGMIGVFAIAGSVVFYEAFAQPATSETQARSDGLRWAPMAAATDGGATFGIAGRF